MNRSLQECDDPGRRWFLFRLPFLTAGGLMFLSAACQGKAEELDSLLKAPLKLPPEPKSGEVGRSLEVLTEEGSYLYSKIVPRETDPTEKKRLIFLQRGNGEEIVLGQDIGLPDNRALYFDYAFLPTGEIVLASEILSSGGRKCRLTIINSQTGEEIRQFEITINAEKDFNLARVNNQNDVRLSSSITGEGTLIKGSKDGTLISLASVYAIWDVRTGKSVYDYNEQKQFMAMNFFWAPKDRQVLLEGYLLNGGWDLLKLSQFRLLTFDPYSELLLSQDQLKIDVSPEGHIRSFSEFSDWSPDGEYFAFERKGRENEIQVFDNKGKEVIFLETKGQPSSVQFSPDGRYIACFIHEGRGIIDFTKNDFSTSLLIWDFKNGKKQEVPIRPKPSRGERRFLDDGFLFWSSPDALVLFYPRLTAYWDPGESEPVKVFFIPLKDLLEGKIDLTKKEEGVSVVTLTENEWRKITLTDITRKKLGIVTRNYKDFRDFNGDLAILDFETKEVKNVGRGSRIIFQKEGQGKEEKRLPHEGDLATASKKTYRLLNGRKYPLFASSGIFRGKSQFKGQVLRTTEKSLQDIPEGVIASEIAIFDWAGRPRRNNKEGGRKIVYGPGLLTKTGAELPLAISLDSTFSDVRRVLEEKGDFQEEDSFYFTYDKNKNWFGYRKTDTMQDPLESIALFSQLIKEWKEAHPLDNLNLILHSLGGVVGLHAAYEHLEIINNIITLDSPHRGLPPILDKNILQILLSALGEKVASFLLRAWNDKVYQERLRQIMTKAKERGIGIYTFASTDDLIVPWQSAVLEEATTTIGGRAIELAFSMGISKLNPLDFGHGQVLGNSKVLGYISEIVGKRNF